MPTPAPMNAFSTLKPKSDTVVQSTVRLKAGQVLNAVGKPTPLAPARINISFPPRRTLEDMMAAEIRYSNGKRNTKMRQKTAEY